MPGTPGWANTQGLRGRDPPEARPLTTTDFSPPDGERLRKGEREGNKGPGTAFVSRSPESQAMKPARPARTQPSTPRADQGVRVPIWFTVAQALKVADLKNVEHILVEEAGQTYRLASRAILRQAPATDLLARWASPPERLAAASVEDLSDQGG